MDLYRQLDIAYQHIVRRPHPRWLTAISPDPLDDIVTSIRDDRPDPTASDTTLRTMIDIGRHEPDALTVAMHALAPKLRARLGRTVTNDYRHDVLTDLALVLLDSPLDGQRIAARLVNRAHNRTYKAARHTHTRGTVNVIHVAPADPEHFTIRSAATEDIASRVARRVDIARFGDAVNAAITSGQLSETAWTAYRNHRLCRAIDPDAEVCTSHERTTAGRTARKLRPFVERHLHAA